MASCLGLYIEDNLIKYAKVSKEKDVKKVEAFGVKFYDRIEDGIRQIVEETYSYKIPICVNLSEENYQYFNMFALLSKNDLDKAIRTEFDAFCEEKGFSASAFETRYAVTEDLENSQNLKVIFVSDNKMELNKKLQYFEKYKLTGVYPLPMAIATVSEAILQQNSIVVNIEEHTTITTIIDKKINDIKVLEQGTGDFLDKINLKENSFAKAYEMCKETTIYTSEGRELTEEQIGYLEEIMPVLYPIVGQVQKSINESFEKIDNVYITGTASLINNIDLYFQEYLDNVTCEILKPNFIKITPDINIKDYIEVNSAIAIANMGLGEGVGGMNFRHNAGNSRLKDFLKLEIGKESLQAKKGKLLTNDLGEPLDRSEKRLLNAVAGFLILLIVYSTFSIVLRSGFVDKLKEAEMSIQNSKKQIALAEADDNAIKEMKNNYVTKIKNLDEISRRIDEKNRVRGVIPGLLNQIMNVMPKGAKLTYIENTDTNHIKITVESPTYEQIAYLISSIKNDGILINVLSTIGQKTQNMISVNIEGELP